MAICSTMWTDYSTSCCNSVQQRRQMRRQFRKIFKWAVLTLVSIIVVLIIFLMGTVAAATGKKQIMWYMYIAGIITLLLCLVPVSNLMCILFIKYKYDCITDVPVSQPQHDNQLHFANQEDSWNREFRSRNSQNSFNEPVLSQLRNSRATYHSSPPSYEIALQMPDLSSGERNYITRRFSFSTSLGNEQSSFTSRSAEEASLTDIEDTRL